MMFVYFIWMLIVNFVYILLLLFIHFISLLMYSLGTNVIVQVIFGELLKALMLLCRGDLSDTDVIVKICCSKPLKALMLWCRGALFSFKFWNGKQPCPKYVVGCICQCFY